MCLHQPERTGPSSCLVCACARARRPARLCPREPVAYLPARLCAPAVRIAALPPNPPSPFFPSFPLHIPLLLPTRITPRRHYLAQASRPFWVYGSVALIAIVATAGYFSVPTAALQSHAAEQSAGAIVEEGLLGGDARPPRHSKSGYIVQAEPRANLKTSKADHAAGASDLRRMCRPCMRPSSASLDHVLPSTTPHERTLPPKKRARHLYTTSNYNTKPQSTKHTHVGATRSTTRNPVAESTPWP